MLLTRSRNDELPGAVRICEAGLNWAVMPWLVGMLSEAVAPDLTAGSVCEVAMAANCKSPGEAKLTAPVVIGIHCDSPGASVTVVVPRLATRAAGPPRAR